MRSSESANKASPAISVRIRCRPGSRNTLATAASQNTYSSGRQRARAARWWATWSSTGDDMRPSALLAARAGEQALRTQQQDDDHDGVDHEGSELGDVVFAGHVGDTDQQRGDERSGDARGAADCHHDQKIDHVFEREGRVEAENLGPERPAEAGKAGPEGEGQGKDRIDVDAEAARDPRVVDRRAQPAAEPGAREDELQADREQTADDDDQQPIAPDADAEDLEPPLQHTGDLDEDLLRAHHVVDGGD